MTKRTLDEIKAIEDEMEQRLASIPAALSNPFSHYQALLEEVSVLERTISRLKAFINFLHKLNPAQYFQWMQKAFASYTATNKPASKETLSAKVSHELDKKGSHAEASEQRRMPAPKPRG